MLGGDVDAVVGAVVVAEKIPLLFALVPSLCDAVGEKVEIRSALFDHAMSTMIEMLRDSSYSPFRHRAAKMLQEERYHLLYAEGWLETLAKNPGTRRELEASLSRIYPQTLAWFELAGAEGMKVAVREKVIGATGEEIRRTFVERMQRSLRDAGIELRTP